MSQALWGDVVYVKSFTDFHRQSPTLLLKLALILHENYQSFDLAAVALREHDKLTDSSLVIEYIQKLTGQAS
jgi:hypothetical protein